MGTRREQEQHRVELGTHTHLPLKLCPRYRWGWRGKGSRLVQWNPGLWVVWTVGVRFLLQLENSPFLLSHVGLETI